MCLLILIPFLLVLSLQTFGLEESGRKEGWTILPEEVNPNPGMLFLDPESRYKGFYEDGDRTDHTKFHYYFTIWEKDVERDGAHRKNNRHSGKDLTPRQLAQVNPDTNTALVIIYVGVIFCTWVPYAISVCRLSYLQRRAAWLASHPPPDPLPPPPPEPEPEPVVEPPPPPLEPEPEPEPIPDPEKEARERAAREREAENMNKLAQLKSFHRKPSASTRIPKGLLGKGPRRLKGAFESLSGIQFPLFNFGRSSKVRPGDGDLRRVVVVNKDSDLDSETEISVRF
jgi:hypothetical protein